MRKTESLSVGLSGGRPLRMADRSLRRLAVFLAAFGDLLSELRRDMNMTQDELAKVLFVSPGTISNYENNIHFPDVPKLKQIAQYFGVTTDYLLGLSSCDLSPEVLEKRTASGKTWSQTIADVQTLTPDRQRALLRILDDMRTASIIETLKKEKE